MRITLFALYGLLFTSIAFADCNPKNYSELVKCAETSALDIKISQQQLKASVQKEKATKQWINPELEVEHFSKGSEFSETAATVLFNLTMGRRSSDIKTAEAELKKDSITANTDISQAKLNLILSLYRLSHLKREVAIEEETGQTFGKIIKQFEKRPALSPEQKVSLSVFKMAFADHQFSLTKLKNEELEVLQGLTTLTGISSKEIEKNLPSRKTEWLKLEQIQDVESPQELIAQAELEIATSEKSKANSESWPELMIGPSFKETKADGERESITGVSLSMPLPVFSINQGGRAFANEKLTAAKMNLELTQAKAKTKRTLLETKYRSHIASLESVLNSKAVSDKHKEIENLFFKGVISGPLVIEAHRQLFDLEQKRNELEFGAVEALGQILIHDNKFNGVIL